MKIFTGVLFLIMMIASFSASAEMSLAAVGQPVAEQQKPSTEGEDTSEEEEEPDCD